MAEKKIVISGDLILDILRGVNDGTTIRVSGIPEDAAVSFASYDEEEGGKLTLYVYTKADVEGDELDVMVHSSDRLLAMAMDALDKIVANEAPFKRDPLEFAQAVIERHVEIAEEVIREYEDVCRER